MTSEVVSGLLLTSQTTFRIKACDTLGFWPWPFKLITVWEFFNFFKMDSMVTLWTFRATAIRRWDGLVAFGLLGDSYNAWNHHWAPSPSSWLMSDWYEGGLSCLYSPTYKLKKLQQKFLGNCVFPKIKRKLNGLKNVAVLIILVLLIHL